MERGTRVGVRRVRSSASASMDAAEELDLEASMDAWSSDSGSEVERALTPDGDSGSEVERALTPEGDGSGEPGGDEQGGQEDRELAGVGAAGPSSAAFGNSYYLAAITRIQGAWRRYSTAKAEFESRVFEEEEEARRVRNDSSFRNLAFLDQLEQQREEEHLKAIERNRRYASIYAATKIQACYRERFQSLVDASLRIQRARRGQVARQSVTIKSRAGSGQEHGAATQIQARYRGRTARRARGEHTAATQIQSRYRGRITRRKISSQQGELVHEQASAATCIQARYRGRRARGRIGNSTAPAATAARHEGTGLDPAASRERDLWEIEQRKKQDQAALRVQRSVRGKAGRRDAAERRRARQWATQKQEMEHAAVRLQAARRGKVARQHVSTKRRLQKRIPEPEPEPEPELQPEAESRRGPERNDENEGRSDQAGSSWVAGTVQNESSWEHGPAGGMQPMDHLRDSIDQLAAETSMIDMDPRALQQESLEGAPSTDVIAEWFRKGPPPPERTSEPTAQRGASPSGSAEPLDGVSYAMAYLQEAGVKVSEEEMCRLVAEKLAARVVEQQAQISQLQHQTKPLPPATSKKARKKAKAKAARAAAKREKKKRRKRVAALAEPVLRSPPTRHDQDMWDSAPHSNMYGESVARKNEEDLLIINLQQAEAEAEAYRNARHHAQEWSYGGSDAAAVDEAVRSSFALRSGGERLNRRGSAPRSKVEFARRRRASSHAGFGAVGIASGMRGRPVGVSHRTQTASSLLKASETRVQRLQGLLAQLGQQRAGIRAELEAQRNYLASINADLTQRHGARHTVRTESILKPNCARATRAGRIFKNCL